MAEKKQDELVEVFIPRGNDKDEKNLLISVNGKNYLLPRGKKSKVPAYVAYEYERSKQALERLYETQDAMVNNSNALQ